MTGADLFEATRVVLHDTSYGTFSDTRMYAPSEIGNALTAARGDACRYLYGVFAIIGTTPNLMGYNAAMAGGGLPPARARITLGKLLHSVAFSGTPTNVPADFWKIECGLAPNGKYIHPEPPPIGAVLGTNAYQTQVYAQGGKFYGNACTIYYWILPTTTIADNATDLASTADGLPDAFYHAVKFLAAANLVKKERAENEDRYKLLMQMSMHRLSTLN